MGREVAKAVKLRKAKTVVVAPNIEQIESEGGLDDLLTAILNSAEESGLPVVFALSRKKMGQVSTTVLSQSACHGTLSLPFCSFVGWKAFSVCPRWPQLCLCLYLVCMGDTLSIIP